MQLSSSMGHGLEDLKSTVLIIKSFGIKVNEFSSQLCVRFSQAASLRQLEDENHEAAARLEEVVYRGDMLLEKIQSALADIAQSQLRTRNGAQSQSAAGDS